MSATLNRRRTDGASDPRALRVLIVDDDENYRTWLGALLGRFGFAVTTASDGAEGIDVVDHSPAFELLVVDCEMPRMDGLAFIQQARAHERGADSFALMITGREDVETKIAALRMGFDDFIEKSSDELELVAKLGAARRVVSRQQRLDATVRELYGLATRDELTGLANRRFFFTEAERLIGLGADVALVLFDLDGFKNVNDTYGHLGGDRILRDVGALFLRRTRSEDFVARYGGDEFVMLVNGMPIETVETLAARLAEEMGRIQWTFGNDTINVGVTSGIACTSLLQGPTIARLLDAADRDLYKNKWVRHNPDADPSLYEYPDERDASMLTFQAAADDASSATGE
ncbi:MAG: two-component system, cell cycle response regulator [Acidobacteriota bacterium]|jgi:diguanylate cyclase (GGDEF)-like protein|nr:two-component system, cell cycle response regulator [Acidobacteriota bacterium]